MVLKAWEIHLTLLRSTAKNISRVRSLNTHLPFTNPTPQQTDKTVYSNWKSALYGNLKLEIGQNFLKADIHQKKTASIKNFHIKWTSAQSK